MGIIKVVSGMTGVVSFKSSTGVVLDVCAARSGLAFGHYHVLYIEWKED